MVDRILIMTENVARKRNAVQNKALNDVSAPPTTASSLNPVIHERIRLAIVSALAVNEVLSFSELKRLLETTDGNLSVHARKLEDAEFISCTKTFQGRTPRTEYSITAKGRKALTHYLEHMETIIKQVRKR